MDEALDLARSADARNAPELRLKIDSLRCAAAKLHPKVYGKPQAENESPLEDAEPEDTDADDEGWDQTPVTWPRRWPPLTRYRPCHETPPIQPARLLPAPRSVHESPAHSLRELGAVTAQNTDVDLASSFQVREYRVIDVDCDDYNPSSAAFPESADALSGGNALRIGLRRSSLSRGLSHRPVSAQYG